MATQRLQFRLLLAFALTMLCVHPLIGIAFRSHFESISYIFFLLASFSAVIACAWRSMHCTPGMRRSWLLFTAGLVLWFIATAMAAHAQFYEHLSPTAATIEDFFYFFYGVPILLAIASPDEGQLMPHFFWLDGIQALAAGYLAYIAIFSVLPFSDVPLRPVALARLIWIYDVENLLLALFATVRLMASEHESVERRFFKILSGFLWVYAFCACLYNHILGVINGSGLLDLVVDIPFWLLTVTAATAFPRLMSAPPKHRKPMALFIDNARPGVLALALIALSADVAGHFFKIAMTVIFGTLAIYGLRSAMLQGRLLSTQQALEEAGARLEQLALQDGLTGISNRRCFDQRLRMETNRAQRTGSPLSLLLIDIDHFKKLNDTYGHITGDESLIQVAQTLRTAMNRPGDLLARYGGEEFVALLPDTDSWGARNVATRLRDLLARTAHIPALARQVTISIGVTTWENAEHISAEQIVEAADRALYRAKQNGRDRVEFVPLETSPHD